MFQARFEYIGIQFNDNSICKSFPCDNIIFFSIHSSNNLPEFDNRIIFEEHYNQTKIKYSERRVKRLGNSYDTDC